MTIYYWIAAIGMCFIMKYGSILETFRNKTSEVFSPLKKLYKCCLCMGFWAGVILIPFMYSDDYSWLVFPFTCSAICWYADSIITLIHNVSNYFSSSDSSKPNK